MLIIALLFGSSSEIVKLSNCFINGIAYCQKDEIISLVTTGILFISLYYSAVTEGASLADTQAQVG